MSNKRNTSTKRPNIERDISNVYREVRDAGLSYHQVKEVEELSERIMLERQQKVRRFDAIAGVYQTADSILTNSRVTVRVADFSNLEENKEAIAWSDGANIYLNADQLEDISDSTIVSLNGVNYHEVAHLLWTPRKGTELLKTIVDEDLLYYFNVLEEARIENLMISRFPSTKEALVKTSLTYLIERVSDETIANAFPITCGRKHLPIEVRQAVADSFVATFGSDLAKRVSAIVNEYRFLSLPVKADADRAIELVREFSKLIKFENNSQHKPSQSADGKAELGSIGSCDNREPMKSGRNEAGKKQSELAEQAKKADAKSESESLDGAKGESDNEESNSNKNSSDVANANHNKQYDDSSDSNQELDETISNILSKAIDDVMNTNQARQESKQVRKAIKESDQAFSGVGKTSFTYAPADNETRVIAKAFGDELIRLQIDNDPAWDRYRPSGKLNIQRTMNMDINDINRLFDRWDTGNDNYDIEAVVLMDNSGSMGGSMTEACTASWTIKKALESIEGRTTVYIFDDVTKLLYDADDKAGAKLRVVGSGGSTNPIEGLLEAERILSASRRKTKLLFVVTDGEWSDSEKNNAIIDRINSIDGAITSLVFITNGWYLNRMTPQEIKSNAEKWKHNCHTITLVNRPKEIVNVAKDLVRSLSRR